MITKGQTSDKASRIRHEPALTGAELTLEETLLAKAEDPGVLSSGMIEEEVLLVIDEL
jgi:hypothetical protein